MKKYGNWAPTGFDPKGLCAEDMGADKEDRSEWLVLPTNCHRDSGILDQSNWDAAIDMLGGEGENVEIHRFGHWAVGWFEIIIINPNHAETLQIAEDIERSLGNYPILDDSDYSEREWEAARNDLADMAQIDTDYAPKDWLDKLHEKLMDEGYCYDSENGWRITDDKLNEFIDELGFREPEENDEDKDLVLFELQKGKMTQIAYPRFSPKRENYVVVSKYENALSQPMSLQNCINQFSELESQNKEDGFYKVIEK